MKRHEDPVSGRSKKPIKKWTNWCEVGKRGGTIVDNDTLSIN